MDKVKKKTNQRVIMMLETKRNNYLHIMLETKRNNYLHIMLEMKVLRLRGLTLLDIGM